MKHTVWNIPPAVPIPEELTQAGIPSLLSAVLAARGITSAADAADFLSGGTQAPRDPYTLKDMDKAVSRIRLALERGETCAVYGDYDVDGITSTCLLTEYLRGIGLKTELYIPDRLEEGYGLNSEAIEHLKGLGVSLIITVDCGVTAVEETRLAGALGVDMIITDHHECQEELPPAVAVVNPKRPDNGETGRELAGVGVAFKLACALSGSFKDMLDRYADLVAVGTIADVMPLTDENRPIVKVGLEKLKRAPRPGFAALIREAGVHEERLSSTAIGFSLAPRINAAGRLGRVRCAVDLLMEKDRARTAALAAELCDMNRERQRLEAEIWAEAEAMLDGQNTDGPIVLACEGWHQGVIGIVASRLTEAHRVPAIMISLEGDRGKGSCRSYGGFNLFDALSSCGGLLDAFGGHALAAGLNVKRENIDALRAALGKYYRDNPPSGEEGVNPDVLVYTAEMLSMRCVSSLEQLEPCGAGNPRPVFCITDAQLVSFMPIGGGKHISLKLEKFGQVWECVWFGQRAEDLGLSAGSRVDAAFFPQVSEFRGRRSIQLVLQAMRRYDPSPRCREILTGRVCDGMSIDRRELGHLWRSIEGRCPMRVELRYLDRLAPHMSPEMIALGLRVLSEVALAQVELELDGPFATVSLPAHSGKADLMRSPTWRAYHT